MELKADIEYEELLKVIKNLPDDKITQLKADLSTIQSQNKKPLTAFQELLLKGPVMDDEQYKAYKENRAHFNKWRNK